MHPFGKHSCSDLTIYGNAGLGDGFTVNCVHEWIYFDPNKREDRGQQHWPENNNGRRAVLATHETFEEWIEMKNHPESKEHFPKEGSQDSYPPLSASENPATTPTMLTMIRVVGGIKRVVHFTKFPKLTVLCSLSSDGEVGVNTSQHLKKSLEHGKQMGWNTSNNPELLITPQIFYTNPTPSQLEHTGYYNWEEKSKKENTCNVGKLCQIV